MMKISRIWAMPSAWTFTIEPIKNLVERYVVPDLFQKDKGIWVDPFCGENSPAQVRNDLNPENTHAQHHLDALSFLRDLNPNKYDGCLYDPPYSLIQVSEVYKSVGKEFFEDNPTRMDYWSNCKDEVGRILRKDGIVICCGWNSMGLGINRGFEMLEILLVPHGGSKNDTIVTVERKL